MNKFIFSWYQLITLEVDQPRLLERLFGKKTTTKWVWQKFKISGIDTDKFSFEPLSLGAYDHMSLELIQEPQYTEAITHIDNPAFETSGPEWEGRVDDDK